MFYLDTNTCIYYLNGTFPLLQQKLLAHRPAEITVPSIVKAELLYGAFKSQRREENLDSVRRFLQPFAVATFGDPEAEHYSQIRADLEKAGTPIGPNDLIVAATVRAQQGTIVTHNVSEFSRVTELTIEDWTAVGDIGAT